MLVSTFPEIPGESLLHARRSHVGIPAAFAQQDEFEGWWLAFARWPLISMSISGHPMLILVQSVCGTFLVLRCRFNKFVRLRWTKRKEMAHVGTERHLFHFPLRPTLQK